MMNATPKQIQIIGIPMDYGQSRRGVDMGPSAVRYAGLQGHLERLGLRVNDNGNVHVPVPEEVRRGDSDERLTAVQAVCEAVYHFGRECIQHDDFALFLGGDHSISIGTVAAAAQDSPVGVIWIDAHGDFNTPETSPSGNLHGMPVAILTGEGPGVLVDLGYAGPKVQPAEIVQIGIRDLDREERQRLVRSGIQVYTMRHVDEMGIATVAYQALSRLRHVSHLHVSLDMDAMDPRFAPGVGTPVRGGLGYREAHLLMEILSDSGRVRSLDVVEINPILDEGNRTAEMAVELIASLLGQRIL